MRTSNAAASRILREFGAVACTDVTGFGLAGHLLEMLRASGVGAVVWPDRVPALPGALELAVPAWRARWRRRTGDCWRVPDRLADCVAVRSADFGRIAGGNCLARAEACVIALRNQGIAAAIIGVVEYGEPAVRLEQAATDGNLQSRTGSLT